MPYVLESSAVQPVVTRSLLEATSRWLLLNHMPQGICYGTVESCGICKAVITWCLVAGLPPRAYGLPNGLLQRALL
jgi:hypothetical protein